MFREFVVPALESEANDVDAMAYHLDGPDAIKHVDALCEIGKLDMILWVPGFKDQHRDWTWLFDKIESLGKGYARRIDDHEEIKRLCRGNRPKKLFIYSTASSKMEAEDLIAELDRICADQ